MHPTNKCPECGVQCTPSIGTSYIPRNFPKMKCDIGFLCTCGYFWDYECEIAGWKLNKWGDDAETID
jgi:hypothetical protein